MYVGLNVRCLIFLRLWPKSETIQILVNVPSMKFRGNSSCGSALFRADKETDRHATTARPLPTFLSFEQTWKWWTIMTVINEVQHEASSVLLHEVASTGNYRCFGETCCLRLQGLSSLRKVFHVSHKLFLEYLDPEAGGSQALRNVSNYIPIGTTPYRRRLQFSSALLWDLQMSRDYKGYSCQKRKAI